MTSLPEVCAKTAEYDIDTNEPVYLITWVPNPKLLDTKQEDNYVKHYAKIFMKFYQCMSAFVISPELTAAGNIHYHGWYQLRDKIRWFKQVLPSMKYIGFVKIEKVRKKLQKALKYYKKEIRLMNEFMSDCFVPVPITHHDVIPKETVEIKKKKIRTYFNKIHDEINRDWKTKQFIETKEMAENIIQMLNGIN